jgi:hypothetical protein
VSDSGGAAYGSVLNNCLLARNSAVSYNGGGALSCTLKNCTLAGNSAYFYGGGAYTSALTNCIVYYNTAYSGPNYESSSLAYCCAMPLAPGPGNFTNEPCFASADGCGNLRLQPGSPCRDAGNNALALGLTDLDGNPRITSGKVDLGAYEFPCADSFQAWLAQYGLPTDGSADCTDPDHDGCNNWQEWVAGTDPCSTESALRILSVTTGPSGRTVTWSSANYRFYSLQAATNLAAVPDFHDVQPNIQGWPGTTSWTDPTAVGSAPKFYRVRVEN